VTGPDAQSRAATGRQPLLEVNDLVVRIGGAESQISAVRGVTFSVERGETLCIVGESGCGKSLTALAMMRLLPPGTRLEATRMRFQGVDLLKASAASLRDMRGRDIGMIFQDPMTSLNPLYTVGEQLTETYMRHRSGKAREARERAEYLLGKVGITNAAERMLQYPHQLSGGLRQRVLIAMALMCGPKMVIADEPTTALDVTIQIQVLVLLRQIQRELDLALVLITHDLGVVARFADRVAVMYAGQVVEAGVVDDVFRNPQHPYTRGLLECLPGPRHANAPQRLVSIPGSVPGPRELDAGCSFRNRCPLVTERCSLPVPLFEGAAGRQARCIHAALERMPA